MQRLMYTAPPGPYSVLAVRINKGCAHFLWPSPRIGHLVVGVDAQSKVGQLDLVAGGQQDVLRLHVAVDHALRVAPEERG